VHSIVELGEQSAMLRITSFRAIQHYSLDLTIIIRMDLYKLVISHTRLS